MGRHKLLLSPLCCLQSLLTPAQFYEHIKPTDSTLSDWNVVHWGTRTVKSLQKPLCSHQFLASRCPVAALCCKRCMIHHPMKSLDLFPQAAARPLYTRSVWLSFLNGKKPSTKFLILLFFSRIKCNLSCP